MKAERGKGEKDEEEKKKETERSNNLRNKINC